MLIDARTVPANTLVESDVCVVGAGAAGITLARELESGPVRVCLLESGGLRPDRRTDALGRGENVGLPYPPLEHVRSRSLGGATNLWVGTCRPLDEIDLQTRRWVPESGWPLGRALRMARITPDELMGRMTAGETLMTVDLWSEVHVDGEGGRIPGALHVHPDELERRHSEIARDREIVLYCS